MPFSFLGLSPALVRAAGELGFATPTPIQAEAIPAALRGVDLLGGAQTGSGKTAAFALPLLQRLEQGQQHATANACARARAYARAGGPGGRSHPKPGAASAATAQGGRRVRRRFDQSANDGYARRRRRGGRNARPTARSGAAQRAQTCVSGNAGADEADRLLDLGFAEELDRVLRLLPPKRQNLFFSATFPPAVQVWPKPCCVIPCAWTCHPHRPTSRHRPASDPGRSRNAAPSCCAT